MQKIKSIIRYSAALDKEERELEDS